MKITTMGRESMPGLFALLVLAAFGIVATANAQFYQSYAVASFTLPFEAHWGAKVIPAGDYTIRVRIGERLEPPLVCSADGKIAFYTPFPRRQPSDKGPAALFVVASGKGHMVRSLNLPKSGLSLVYQPTTNAEREILAKAEQVQPVQLTSVEK